MLQDTTLDLFKYSAFPTIAAAVRARSESILRRWEQLVREKLASAEKLSFDQLRDDLPSILQHMADTLEVTDASSMPSFERASKGHGADRLSHCYSVNEVLIEFGLLRPIIIDQVSDELGRPMTVAEMAALNMGIDTAARRSVTRCVDGQYKQLRLASDAQTKYLAFLSHDLRGGLNGVMLTAELLKRQLAGEERFSEQVEDIDAMRRSILETVATMDRFLHAERFRQGKVQPAAVTVEISSLLQSLVSHFTYTLREKSLQLKVEAPDSLTVVTDKDLLWLILQNLTSNALKYTTRGAVRVLAEPVAIGDSGAVSGGRVGRGAAAKASADQQAQYLRISVLDQGPGIPPAQVPTLFEAFTRGDTHGQPGVGLGLYIVRQAADLIGATLAVESTVGKGASFHVTLPMTPGS
jgi:signal transduction histidine kinase